VKVKRRIYKQKVFPDLGCRKGRATNSPLLFTKNYLLITTQYLNESLCSLDVFPNCAANIGLTFCTLSADEAKVKIVLTTDDENDIKVD